MPSFTPISSTVETVDGVTSTCVTASFSYGDVTEEQKYCFEGELTAEDVLSRLTAIAQEYQTKWDAQQATVNSPQEVPAINDVGLPLETVAL